MLVLGGGYYFATAICCMIIQREGPSPLYLLVLLFGRNTLKFLWIGPTTLVLLIATRAGKRQEQQARTQGADQLVP